MYQLQPRLFLSLFAVIGGLAANSVQADVLVLNNGDRITGTIKRVWDGEVTIEPDYADEFAVDLDAVRYAESDREFDIRLPDGRKSTATLAGVDADGRQVIEIDGEDQAMSLAAVLEIEEQEDYFDWESHIDVAVAINKGNTDSETGKVSGDTKLKVGDHRHLAEMLFNRESQQGVSIKEQDLFKYNYNWLFRDPWFFGLSGSYERDPIRDLSGRLIGAASIGRDIWDRPHKVLNFQLGLGYQNENIGGVTDNSAVAIWALRFSYDLFRNDLETFHNHSITTNLSGRDNTVLKTSTGLRYEITDLLYANLSVDYDYETDPADVASKSDLTFLWGIGAEF